MMKRIILSLTCLVLFAGSLVAQDARRVTVEKAGISFIPAEFLTQLGKDPSMYVADETRFGKAALLILSTYVNLPFKTEADARLFEQQLATTEVQLDVANKYVKGFGDQFGTMTIDKSRLIKRNQLPTIKIDTSFKVASESYKTTLLVFSNRQNSKAYYVAWLGTEKNFDDLSTALQSVLDSIEFK